MLQNNEEAMTAARRPAMWRSCSCILCSSSASISSSGLIINTIQLNQPVEYLLPDNLLGGDEDLNVKNRRLAGYYTDIAIHRDNINRLKIGVAVTNMKSFDRSVKDLRGEIERLRVLGEALRQTIKLNGGEAFEEPDPFKVPV